MASVTLEVQGLEELQRALRRAPQMAQSELAISMERATYRLLTEAQRRTPVDTGRLRSSLTKAVYRGADVIEGTVGTRVFYALYIEYGTGIYGEGPGAKGRRYFPPPGALEVWARRHGFESGYEVARAIWLRGGTEPRRFLRGALEHAQSWIEREFSQAVERVLKRLGRE